MFPLCDKDGLCGRVSLMASLSKLRFPERARLESFPARPFKGGQLSKVSLLSLLFFFFYCRGGWTFSSTQRRLGRGVGATHAVAAFAFPAHGKHRWKAKDQLKTHTLPALVSRGGSTGSSSFCVVFLRCLFTIEPNNFGNTLVVYVRKSKCTFRSPKVDATVCSEPPRVFLHSTMTNTAIWCPPAQGERASSGGTELTVGKGSLLDLDIMKGNEDYKIHFRCGRRPLKWFAQ